MESVLEPAFGFSNEPFDEIVDKSYPFFQQVAEWVWENRVLFFGEWFVFANELFRRYFTFCLSAWILREIIY